MRNDLRRAGVLAVLVAAAAFAGIRAAPPAGVNTRPAGVDPRPTEVQTYITVLDTDRRPVVGLSEEDFAMRDGGVREHVSSVEPATDPLSVAVVIDTDGFDPADLPAVNTALAAATRKLTAADPRHQVLMPKAGAGPAPLVDALTAACQSLRSAPTDRRVVLAIIRRRAGDSAVANPRALTDAIMLEKTAVWTVEVGPVQTTPLDRLLADSTNLSGALREIVPAVSGMSEAATRIADLLVSQYVLTYTWPNPMLSQINITIRHDRGVVLAPIWRR